MDDFVYNYFQECNDNVKFCVKEKKIYQIETIGKDFADKNARDLAFFYAMCGKFRQYESQGASQGKLPYHNPIAFFQRILELNSIDRQLYTCLMDILPYVLACRGYVFNTTFYAEGLYSLHPCDLDYVINVYGGNEDMYANVLRSQAELQIGYSFQKEKKYYSSVIHRLAYQKEQIERWLHDEHSEGIDSHPSPWECNIEEIEKKFWSFFDIYSNFGGSSELLIFFNASIPDCIVSSVSSA